jgi:hypothetical protein
MIKKIMVMKNQILKLVSLLSLLVIISVSSYSQGKTVITPYIQLQYFKNSDDQRILQTTLTYSKNRMELPLPGMEISFYSDAGKKVLLTSVITDEKGIAKFMIGDATKLTVNSGGLWAFSSEFKGNDTIEAGKSEITIKDVQLEMTLSEADSVRTITLKAVSAEKGREVPVSGEVVKIYVPRMFSLLPVGEATLNETGAASIEFPADLPGDTVGNITIISRFEEHPAFGNVERRIVQKWGVPTKYLVPSTHRALWTKTPPRWMIITLSVLLAGVWGHYLFAVISLIIIRIDARRKAKEEYRI